MYPFFLHLVLLSKTVPICWWFAFGHVPKFNPESTAFRRFSAYVSLLYSWSFSRRPSLFRWWFAFRHVPQFAWNRCISTIQLVRIFFFFGHPHADHGYLLMIFGNELQKSDEIANTSRGFRMYVSPLVLLTRAKPVRWWFAFWHVLKFAWNPPHFDASARTYPLAFNLGLPRADHGYLLMICDVEKSKMDPKSFAYRRFRTYVFLCFHTCLVTQTLAIY